MTMAANVVAVESWDGSEKQPPTLVLTARTRQAFYSTRWKLLAMWVLIALFPWTLQVRSVVQLALPHKIPPALRTSEVGDEPSSIETSDLATRCPMTGLVLTGVWWNIWPIHYTDVGAESDAICHFVIQQYNIHGSYRIMKQQPTDSAIPNTITESLSESCRESSDFNLPVQFFFYHGSIGYYSFFASAHGVYCTADTTGYFKVDTLGSADLNGQALTGHATNERAYEAATHWSYWYFTFGTLWLSFRAVVLHRSLVLCSQLGTKYEGQRRSVPFRSIVLFIQESSRLAPHGANNAQRIVIAYCLVEGLMADIFLQIARYGLSVRLQYFSVGYNLASLVWLLFEMIESTPLLSSRTCYTIRRFCFNIETGYLGELVCASFFHRYLASLNHSRFKDSLQPAQSVSFYGWSLVGHGVLVTGLALIIISVRVVGAVIFTRLRYASIKVLTAPNCVDAVLRGRTKFVMLSGYVWRHGRLYYSRETLKAFALFQVDNGDGELLVHTQMGWVGSSRRSNLVIIGRIVDGHHVEQLLPIQPYVGHVTWCDRILGGRLDIVDMLSGRIEATEQGTGELVQPSDEERAMIV